MSEENVINDYAADADIAAPRKRGRPAKVSEETSEPTNTIINLEVPQQIIVTKAQEQEPEVEAPLSEKTRMEMELGRKILAGYR